MPGPKAPESETESVEDSHAKARKEQEKLLASLDTDPATRVMALETIMAFHASFSLQVISPFIHPIDPPIIHMPESLEDRENRMEHVYPIKDQGDILSTSKANNELYAGFSQCRLYYTIEKMIWLLQKRLRSGGIQSEDEVEITVHSFHAPVRRYAFASIINMPKDNIIIVNFDPGSWGENYLDTVSRMADKYGYPKESPRVNVFRQSHGDAEGPKQ